MKTTRSITTGITSIPSLLTVSHIHKSQILHVSHQTVGHKPSGRTQREIFGRGTNSRLCISRQRMVSACKELSSVGSSAATSCARAQASSCLPVLCKPMAFSTCGHNTGSSQRHSLQLETLSLLVGTAQTPHSLCRTPGFIKLLIHVAGEENSQMQQHQRRALSS